MPALIPSGSAVRVPVGDAGDPAQRDRAVGAALHPHLAVGELEVVGARPRAGVAPISRI